jgi:pimeloyl-ACP methyl ester carboxylesterase
MVFEPNRGQADAGIRFLARGRGYTLALKPDEAVFSFWAGGGWRPDSTAGPTRAAPGGRQQRPRDLRMRLAGADPAAQAVGLDERPGKANYMIGSDPRKWLIGLPTFARVLFRGVYPGVDLIYYDREQQLEYDFHIAPGAGPEVITLDFDGTDSVEIDARGELVLHTEAGEVRQAPPVVYQEIGGARQPVSGRYVLKGGLEVGFEVGPHDPTLPLVIDPVLSYSTYLGTGEVAGIAVDRDHNAYLTGKSVPGAPPENGDFFVAKLNPKGSAFLYFAVFGGEDLDFSAGIAVDSSGNAYVTGSTRSRDFPTHDPMQAQCSGTASGPCDDAFVMKLDPSGLLVYSTYLGGGMPDFGRAIAVDGAGNAYVTGSTESEDDPQTPEFEGFPLRNAFQSSPDGGLPTSDAFVTKLNAAGSDLVYSTYLGGNNIDEGLGIAVDGPGNAYVTGGTFATDFPTLNAFQGTSAGFEDAFVTKFNPGGSVVYSTYLGGDNLDEGSGIAVDGSGNTYVIGTTLSADFPVSNALQPTIAGDLDAFVTKLDAAGQPVYSTYLGGTDLENGRRIAVDPLGSAYAVGATLSGGFPTLNAFQPSFGGACSGGRFCTDAFVTKLSADGTRILYSSFLGGRDVDAPFGIDIDDSGSLYVAGVTFSDDFPTANPMHPAPAGSRDGFVSKIAEPPLVFIHGISASYLVEQFNYPDLLPAEELWLGILADHGRLSLFPEDNPSPKIVSTDAFRTLRDPVIGAPLLQVYTALLDALKTRGGYREYEVNGYTLRRTTRDCDLAQKDKMPNLFVFAYDWRKDNAQNAVALADYVGCVQKFYSDSNTGINLLTHSMGSLLARRYILDHPNVDDPNHLNVNALITIGAPWLGGPKLTHVLETGDFVPFFIAFDATIRNIAGSFTAAHQLLPGRAWFELGGPAVYGEDGFDLDGDGNSFELYSDYDHYIDVINQRHSRSGFHPGTAGDAFHSYANAQGDRQDNWQEDGTGVKYYHIYGVQSRLKTIRQVLASAYVSCDREGFCFTKPVFRLTLDRGDGTVPFLSAARLGNGLDYNATNANLFQYCSDGSFGDAGVEHTGMAANPVIIDRVLDLLVRSGRPQEPPPGTPACLPSSDRRSGADAHGPAPAQSARGERPGQAEGLPPALISTVLTVYGAGPLTLQDAQGNSTAPLSETIRGSVPGVQTYVLGDRAEMAVIPAPAQEEYTIEFRTTAEPLGIELIEGTGESAPTRAIRYRDLELPPGVLARLKITPQSIEDLVYDADGDGLFETSVAPAVSVSGPAAADVVPPVVSIGLEQRAAAVLITIAAQDSGSGVRSIRYSLDGASFQAYTQPLTVDPVQVPAVYAFAEDNVANRSSLIVRQTTSSAATPTPGGVATPTPTRTGTPAPTQTGTATPVGTVPAAGTPTSTPVPPTRVRAHSTPAWLAMVLLLGAASAGALRRGRRRDRAAGASASGLVAEPMRGAGGSDPAQGARNRG